MRQLVQEKENSEFKPVKLCLKIDLVSHSARSKGLVNKELLRRLFLWWDFHCRSCLPEVFLFWLVLKIIYIYIWEEMSWIQLNVHRKVKRKERYVWWFIFQCVLTLIFFWLQKYFLKVILNNLSFFSVRVVVGSWGYIMCLFIGLVFEFGLFLFQCRGLQNPQPKLQWIFHRRNKQKLKKEFMNIKKINNTTNSLVSR